jgi:hypothetical protein
MATSGRDRTGWRVITFFVTCGRDGVFIFLKPSKVAGLFFMMPLGERNGFSSAALGDCSFNLLGVIPSFVASFLGGGQSPSKLPGA